MTLEQSSDTRLGVDVFARSKHSSPCPCALKRRPWSAKKERPPRLETWRKRLTCVFLVIWAPCLEEDLDSVEGGNGGLGNAACRVQSRKEEEEGEKAREDGE